MWSKQDQFQTVFTTKVFMSFKDLCYTLHCYQNNYHKHNSVFQCASMRSLVKIQSWDSTMSSASTSTMYQSATVEFRLYALFKFEFKRGYVDFFFQLNLLPPYSLCSQGDNLFSFKILALAGIWTRDLSGTKPICYQLSYPGLDYLFYFIILF